MSELLEREPFLTELERSLQDASNTGRLVFVGGEAGVGKTALVRRFCAARDAIPVLWGACDPLTTPRPLGPFADAAATLGGELERLVGEGGKPYELARAMLSALRARGLTVVVLEDVHWADDATLDVLRMLGRRIAAARALVIATFRDDELGPTHPLRVVLGELATSATVRRLTLRPLSLEAVRALAADSDVDGDELHRQTSGNPFFVTEVLATGGDQVPATVRDAVLARAARVGDGARRLLELVAVAPPRAELTLLENVAGETLRHLDECLSAGMLMTEPAAVAFRHELARLAIEEAIPVHREVQLHRSVLGFLTAAGDADPARLAHHAELAADAESVLRFAPLAAERAASFGAHREAAAQYARALRFADGLSPQARSGLLERRSYECYLTDQIDEAIEARRAALECHRRVDDRLKEGDSLRWLSRLYWFTGNNSDARTMAHAAVDLLERLPPGRELAMAYSNLAHLAMLANDDAAAVEWGGRAISLAEELGDEETLVHALNNVGTTTLRSSPAEGRRLLERSLDIARAAGLEEHVARAYTNLGSTAVQLRDFGPADAALAEGIAYCEEHDLQSWCVYMSGWLARSHLDQGRWGEAAEIAGSVLRNPRTAVPARITALVVLGLLRARRGDPDVWGPLDEAIELARQTTEVQRLAPTAAGRAEARWLAADHAEIAAETDAAYALALEAEEPWAAGELAVWRKRAGIDEPSRPVHAEPFRLELEGRWAEAADAWLRIGCPYEAALALAGGDEPALRRAHNDLRGLQARPAAAVVARRLRERGARDVRRGPRPATRANPAGLTAREVEVLSLVARGLTNAEVGQRLFVSAKTVDHHVSSILRKLGARTRGEASAQAVRLGLAPRDR